MMQCQMKCKVPVEKLINIPKWAKKKFDGYSKRFMPKLTVKTNIIQTRDQLVSVIFNNFGYGRWNCLFLSRYVKNKKYAPCQQCVRRYHLRLNKQRIRKKHDKRFCKKTITNWIKKFECIITSRVPDETGIDYVYKIYFNTMHSFWFWKG